MKKEIKKGNLNYDGSGRAYPDNPQIKENWNCIWENNGKYYKLVGDNEHKEWSEININNFEPIFEPTKNRFMIVEMLGLPPYVVKSMSNLMNYGSAGNVGPIGWSPVEFELYSVSGILKSEHEVVSADFNVEHRLINYVNNHKDIELNIGVKILDATGKEVVTMILSECDFIRLDLGSKNWSSDDITKIKFIVKPKSVSSYTNL